MNLNVGHLGLALVIVGATLIASPTLGFETIAADRTTQVETAADSAALVGFESTAESIDGRQDTATVLNLRNNANEPIDLSTDISINTSDVRIAGNDDGSGMVSPGASNSVRLECNGGGGEDTAAITATVTATGTTISVEGASSTTTVEYRCRGRVKPGAGFDDVSVQDVTTYTGPGDARQRVSFTPSEELRPNSQVTIDLSAAHPEGVDYTRINWEDYGVDRIEGNGEVTQVTQQGVITYQTGGGGNNDPGGEQIVLSIDGYETSSAAGPIDAEITREDSGETGTAPFYVVDDGGGPIEDVSVEDVAPNVQTSDGATQTISFTLSASPDGSDQLVVDLSDVQGSGVDYNGINSETGGVVIQRGDGDDAWYRRDDNTIRYQASDADAAGDTIVLEVQGYETDSSGGPYTVGVYWDRYDYEGTDTFSIRNG